jgi:serine/threonine protein kinase
MVKTSACPDVSTLKKLAVADLPPDEMELLLGHLQECDACLAKLPTFATTDTLVDVLAKTKTLSNSPDDPLLAAVIERLAKLGQTPATAPAAAAKPINFACASCGKSLKVKAELAGKKIKCPGCGKMVAAPALSQSAEPATPSKSGIDLSGDKTILPQAPTPTHVPTVANLGEERTMPPQSRDTKSGLSGVAQSGSQATQGVIPDGNTEGIDFLAPAQLPDELGRLGTYRILKKLGAGGMGMVFLAEDTVLHRKVAIKVMLPQFAASNAARERFLREARSAASIEHEHIVPIFQVGEDNKVPFLAMPFLKGEPLDACLEREGKLPLAEALRIAKEMADGLAAAHANNLIHRDIKPGNVWLEGKKAKVRLLDFGLARAQDDTTNLTQTGALVGTPAYMAPEQARGDKLDGRADLFSLGCVLYVMLTGQRPFKGNDTLSLLMSLATETPTLPTLMNPAVPDAVSDLTMRLLAKDAAERPASAQAVADELSALMEGEPSPVRGRSATAPATKPKKKSRKAPVLVALAAICAALLLGAAGIIFYWQTNNGIVRIEINDPDIQVVFGDKELTFKGADKQHDVKVSTGPHKLHVKRGNDFEFDTSEFLLKRGETITLKIEWFPAGKLQVVQADKVIGAKERPKPDLAIVPPAAVPYALRYDGTASVAVSGLSIPITGDHTLEAFVTPTEKKAGGIIVGTAGRGFLAKVGDFWQMTSNLTAGRRAANLDLPASRLA